MPRKRTLRKIVEPPKFKGFRPYGCNNDSSKAEVELLYEEYEAIKLADYSGMSHHEACVLMGISRPTFARIYESARRKVAVALVEVKSIKSVYGNASLEGNWFKCAKCFNLFTIPSPGTKMACPICKFEEIENINKNN